MLNFLVLAENANDARHKYLMLVDQLREAEIKYRQHFNQLVITTDNTRTKFVFSRKQFVGITPIPDVICGTNKKLIDVNDFGTVSDHEPIYYIKQKELDEWNTI